MDEDYCIEYPFDAGLMELEDKHMAECHKNDMDEDELIEFAEKQLKRAGDSDYVKLAILAVLLAIYRVLSQSQEK